MNLWRYLGNQVDKRKYYLESETMLIDFTNDFHNTKVTMRVSNDLILSASQVRKMKKTLCGIADCQCSYATGTRGTQYIHYADGTYERVGLELLPSKEVIIRVHVT